MDMHVKNTREFRNLKKKQPIVYILQCYFESVNDF